MLSRRSSTRAASCSGPLATWSRRSLASFAASMPLASRSPLAPLGSSKNDDCERKTFSGFSAPSSSAPNQQQKRHFSTSAAMRARSPYTSAVASKKPSSPSGDESKASAEGQKEQQRQGEPAEGKELEHHRGSAGQGGALSLDPTNYKEFCNTLNLASDEIDLGKTGSGATNRILHNFGHGAKKFEASCIEIRMPKAQEEFVCARNRTVDFAALRAKRKAGSLDEPTPEERPEEQMYSNTTGLFGDAEPEVVFYYETATEEGLQGFQRIASMVKEKNLPGKCSNDTGVAGYATWAVPRSQYLHMVSDSTKIGDGTSPSDNNDGSSSSSGGGGAKINSADVEIEM